MGRSPSRSQGAEGGLNKGPWTEEEDAVLSAYIKANGEGNWRKLPKQAGLARCRKSCRLRWMNYLRPDLKRGNFSPDEDELIIKLHSLLGNRWSLIAGRIPGRTDNEIKNHWNTRLKRKLSSMGIDPSSHKVDETPSACSSAETATEVEIEDGHTMETHIGHSLMACFTSPVPSNDFDDGVISLDDASLDGIPPPLDWGLDSASTDIKNISDFSEFDCSFSEGVSACNSDPSSSNTSVDDYTRILHEDSILFEDSIWDTFDDPKEFGQLYPSSPESVLSFPAEFDHQKLFVTPPSQFHITETIMFNRMYRC